MSIRLTVFIQLLAVALFASSLIAAALPARASSHWVRLSAGDLIKLPDDSNTETTLDTAVYYFAADGLRYVFPNSKTYFTWYNDFSGVKEVSLTQLGTIGIGGNITYRPGIKMIKVDSDPKTYAIDRNGARRHVASEAAARGIYGTNWNRMIDDVPDAFFSHYHGGAAIASADDFNRDAIMAASPNISEDKDLRAPIEVMVNADGGFSPNTVTISQNRTVRFRNNTGATVRVASNPHPRHTDLPGFDSGDIPAGLNYVYRFTRTGTFGFHNHLQSSKQGTVTVQ